MSRLTNKPFSAPFGLFQTVTETLANPGYPFTNSTTLAGERFDASDGREFLLVQNAAVALAAGKLVQSSAIVANHQNLGITAYSPISSTVQVTTITVTLGNTAATADQYAGGFLVVNAGTGLGQTLKIQSHPAANASATLVLTLEDTAVVALATSDSKVCLIANPYVNVIINPASPTNTPIGVTLYAIAASTATTGPNVFGFIQSKGPVSCLADGAVAVGLGIAPSGSVAGAIAIGAATTARIGRALQAAVDTEYRTVYIDL